MRHFNSNLRTPKIENDKISMFIEHITFKVNSVGVWSSNKDTEADYTIEDIEFIFYSKGGSETTVKGQEHLCKTYDLLMLDSQGFYTSKNRGHLEYEYYYIHFNIQPAIYEKMFLDLFYSQSPVISFQDANSIHSLFQKIIKEYQEAKIGYASKMNAYIKILCIEILRNREEDRKIPIYKQVNFDAQRSLVNSTVDYIKANPQLKYKVKELAQHFGVSQNYLFKSFIEVMGSGPQDYILNHKVEMAKDLISSGHYRMDDIALELGFTSNVHFSRVFKLKEGIAPKQYQKQNR